MMHSSQVRASGRRILATLTATIFLAPGPARAAAEAALHVISSRPDTVSGGDAAVMLSAPDELKWTVQLNGTDVTQSFQPDENSGNRLALLTGLRLGKNRITLRVNGTVRTKLELVNHPLTGPVFSGPHQHPFICQTETNGLGPALDPDCSATTVVQYYYKSTEPTAAPSWQAEINAAPGTLSLGFKTYDPAAARPADVAQIVTPDGHTVDYIVRRELGTINRGVYDIQFLHQPGQPLPTPRRRPTPGWNGRLVYSFGGGCGAGYRQGTFGTIGAGEEPFLALGYAVATSTLNVLGNNCNDRLSAETLSMVKEYFIEQYGVPVHTVGHGGSGGAILQHVIAQNYPGLLDGLIVAGSRPDITSPVVFFSDCQLLDHYFAGSKQRWKEEQETAVSGLSTIRMCQGGLIHFFDPKECAPVIPKDLIYDRVKNPKGVRCTLYDNEINVLGRDPTTGFARRPADNVGVQYGRVAFNKGTIDAEHFIDLNAHIGGFDQDGDFVAERTRTDIETLRIAYRSGFMLTGGGGLAEVPILDYRSYGDDLLNNHTRYESFITRERLLRVTGRADNQVIVVYPRSTASDDPALWRSRTADLIGKMDNWLDRVAADGRPGSLSAKVARDRPKALSDTCVATDGEVIEEPSAYNGSDRCVRLYPPYGDPRIASGAPLANDVVKCALKPVDPADYQPKMNDDQLARLKAVFPSGVCDYTKPGIGQQITTATWQGFDGQR